MFGLSGKPKLSGGQFSRLKQKLSAGQFSRFKQKGRWSEEKDDQRYGGGD